MLTNPNGVIFVVLQVDNSYTRIAKYLPDGRLDYSYNLDLNAADKMIQQSIDDKSIVTGQKKSAEHKRQCCFEQVLPRQVPGLCPV